MKKILIIFTIFPLMHFAKSSLPEHFRGNSSFKTDVPRCNLNADKSGMKSCLHVYGTQVTYCDGNTQTINNGSNYGDCGDNADGDIILHIKSVDGCNYNAITETIVRVVELLYYL